MTTSVESTVRRARNITLLAIVFEGTLLLAAVGTGWLLRRSPMQLIGLQWAGLLWGVAATAPLIAAVWWATRTTWRPVARFIHDIEEKLFVVLGGLSSAEIVVISGMAGLAEELMFRGLIQPGLTDVYGTAPALLITSALFGLAHFVSLGYAIVAGLMGAYLGWVAIASGNLLVPIIVHALYDFWALTYLIQHRGPTIRTRLERREAAGGPAPAGPA